MESRVKLFGHPIHPVLIVFPLGLLSAAVIFDILYLVSGDILYPAISFWNIALGVLGGLLAAVFGLIDWLAIPGGTRARSVGLWHGLGNVVVVVLFAISWLLRRDNPDYAPDTFALVLSFAGILLSLLTGWLGGELVYRLSVAVDRGANLEATSSLGGEPASKTTGD
jgi:uncharacterized membrane protein